MKEVILSSNTHKLYVTFDSAQSGYPCVLTVERGARGEGRVSLIRGDNSSTEIVRELEVSALREILKLVESLPPVLYPA